jgi:acyl carrier protein
MNRAELVALIVACCRDNLPSPNTASTLDENTRIFGKDGSFDSLQLVNLLIEVEQRINERYGTIISIADDRAMSQERSPFRKIGSLADYVGILITEQKTSP